MWYRRQEVMVRPRHRRVGIFTGALSAVAGLAILGLLPAQNALASAKGKDTPITAAKQKAAAAAGIAAQNTAQSRYPAVFGGLQLTDGGTHVVVYLTRLDPTVEHDIIGHAPAREFTFLKTSRPLAFLTQLQTRISQAWSSLKAAGINIVSLAVRSAGKLDVTVQHLTPAKARVLNDRYGADNLNLSTTTQPYGGTPLPLPVHAQPTLLGG
jgi:hypothetical protein